MIKIHKEWCGVCPPLLTMWRCLNQVQSCLCGGWCVLGGVSERRRGTQSGEDPVPAERLRLVEINQVQSLLLLLHADGSQNAERVSMSLNFTRFHKVINYSIFLNDAAIHDAHRRLTSDIMTLFCIFTSAVKWLFTYKKLKKFAYYVFRVYLLYIYIYINTHTSVYILKIFTCIYIIFI